VNKPIALNVEGITISGQLYLPHSQVPYPTVCVCHGIPNRVHDPADRGYPALAERICREGFAVLIFNFRGTGDSGGNFDILGWPRDLKAVIDYLWTLSEVDKSHLSLLGYSGGAAVSIYVAAQDKRISCVAACACPAELGFVAEAGEPQAVVEHFRSLGVIRDEGFPHSVEEWLDGFRLIRAIDHVARIAPRPLLLVHNRRDEVVAVSHAHRLYARAREPKELVILDGAEHALRQDEQATSIVIGWLKSRCRG
jgi:fermentation-respiration switch protein FrsA (DUF1100 family)